MLHRPVKAISVCRLKKFEEGRAEQTGEKGQKDD